MSYAHLDLDRLKKTPSAPHPSFPSVSFTVNTAGIAQSVSLLRKLDPEGLLPTPDREAMLSRFLERYQELTTGHWRVL